MANRNETHWKKGQRGLPEPPGPTKPARRDKGPKTLDSLISGKRRRPPWK
jgi:hypothetical protein